jgi:antitoxin component YwqK of YwqJK toxin-antitoxin module
MFKIKFIIKKLNKGEIDIFILDKNSNSIYTIQKSKYVNTGVYSLSSDYTCKSRYKHLFGTFLLVPGYKGKILKYSYNFSDQYTHGINYFNDSSYCFLNYDIVIYKNKKLEYEFSEGNLDTFVVKYLNEYSKRITFNNNKIAMIENYLNDRLHGNKFIFHANGKIEFKNFTF